MGHANKNASSLQEKTQVFLGGITCIMSVELYNISYSKNSAG